MEKKLYLLETQGLGSFYVLSESATQAETALLNQLQISDYGFSDDRKVKTINIIAEEIKEFPEGKLNFSSKNKLIIV